MASPELHGWVVAPRMMVERGPGLTPGPKHRRTEDNRGILCSNGRVFRTLERLRCGRQRENRERVRRLQATLLSEHDDDLIDVRKERLITPPPSAAGIGWEGRDEPGHPAPSPIKATCSRAPRSKAQHRPSASSAFSAARIPQSAASSTVQPMLPGEGEVRLFVPRMIEFNREPARIPERTIALPASNRTSPRQFAVQFVEHDVG